MSDELTLISPGDGQIWPLCRPVSLKNASIEVIRQFAPEADFNRITHDTAKGSVSHLKVLPDHLAQVGVPARPGWVVFPHYQTGSQTLLTPRPRSSALVDLASNSFNFGILGEPAFDALADLVEASQCYDFRYSDLSEALAQFNRLAETP